MQATRNQSRRVTIAFTDCRDRRDRRVPRFESSEQASISQETITGLRHTHRRALVRESGMPMRSGMSSLRRTTRDPDSAIPQGIL